MVAAMRPGYQYRDAQGRAHHEPNDHSKAKQFCGCGAVGNRVVHGAPDEDAILMCEPCLQKLIGILGRTGSTR
jgi:hypothetical protein